MVGSKKASDIIIIGAGATGLSTYYHLKQLGYNIKIIASESKNTTTDKASHWIASGQNDLITRLYHAHGRKSGGLVWGFGDAAFDYFTQFCEQERIPLVYGDRIYLSSSPMEQEELVQVGDILQDTPKALQNISLSSLSGSKQSQAAGFFNYQRFHEVLGTEQLEIDTIKAVKEHAGGITLEGSKGSYSSELVVLCNHVNINNFSILPSEALVPFADQWSAVTLKKDHALEVPNGSLITWNFGYFWVSLRGPQLAHLGGARFMRPLAGIGAEEARVLQPVTQRYISEAEKQLGIEVKEVIQESAALGCRACDELPVLGPSPSNHRILLATGFMGQGICQGLYAGYCLASLIENGSSTLIPRKLWPERLRHL